MELRSSNQITILHYHRKSNQEFERENKDYKRVSLDSSLLNCLLMKSSVVSDSDSAGSVSVTEYEKNLFGIESKHAIFPSRKPRVDAEKFQAVLPPYNPELWLRSYNEEKSTALRYMAFESDEIKMCKKNKRTRKRRHEEESVNWKIDFVYRTRNALSDAEIDDFLLFCRSLLQRLRHDTVEPFDGYNKTSLGSIKPLESDENSLEFLNYCGYNVRFCKFRLISTYGGGNQQQITKERLYQEDVDMSSPSTAEKAARSFLGRKNIFNFNMSANFLENNGMKYIEAKRWVSLCRSVNSSSGLPEKYIQNKSAVGKKITFEELQSLKSIGIIFYAMISKGSSTPSNVDKETLLQELLTTVTTLTRKIKRVALYIAILHDLASLNKPANRKCNSEVLGRHISKQPANIYLPEIEEAIALKAFWKKIESETSLLLFEQKKDSEAIEGKLLGAGSGGKSFFSSLDLKEIKNKHIAKERLLSLIKYLEKEGLCKDDLKVLKSMSNSVKSLEAHIRAVFPVALDSEVSGEMRLCTSRNNPINSYDLRQLARKVLRTRVIFSEGSWLLSLYQKVQNWFKEYEEVISSDSTKLPDLVSIFKTAERFPLQIDLGYRKDALVQRIKNAQNWLTKVKINFKADPATQKLGVSSKRVRTVTSSQGSSSKKQKQIDFAGLKEFRREAPLLGLDEEETRNMDTLIESITTWLREVCKSLSTGSDATSMSSNTAKELAKELELLKYQADDFPVDLSREVEYLEAEIMFFEEWSEISNKLSTSKFSYNQLSRKIEDLKEIRQYKLPKTSGFLVIEQFLQQEDVKFENKENLVDIAAWRKKEENLCIRALDQATGLFESVEDVCQYIIFDDEEWEEMKGEELEKFLLDREENSHLFELEVIRDLVNESHNLKVVPAELCNKLEKAYREVIELQQFFTRKNASARIEPLEYQNKYEQVLRYGVLCKEFLEARKNLLLYNIWMRLSQAIIDPIVLGRECSPSTGLHYFYRFVDIKYIQELVVVGKQCIVFDVSWTCDKLEDCIQKFIDFETQFSQSISSIFLKTQWAHQLNMSGMKIQDFAVNEEGNETLFGESELLADCYSYLGLRGQEKGDRDLIKFAESFVPADSVSFPQAATKPDNFVGDTGALKELQEKLELLLKDFQKQTSFIVYQNSKLVSFIENLIKKITWSITCLALPDSSKQNPIELLDAVIGISVGSNLLHRVFRTIKGSCQQRFFLAPSSPTLFNRRNSFRFQVETLSLDNVFDRHLLLVVDMEDSQLEAVPQILELSAVKVFERDAHFGHEEDGSINSAESNIQNMVDINSNILTRTKREVKSVQSFRSEVSSKSDDGKELSKFKDTPNHQRNKALSLDAFLVRSYPQAFAKYPKRGSGVKATIFGSVEMTSRVSFLKAESLILKDRIQVFGLKQLYHPIYLTDLKAFEQPKEEEEVLFADTLLINRNLPILKVGLDWIRNALKMKETGVGVMDTGLEMENFKNMKVVRLIDHIFQTNLDLLRAEVKRLLSWNHAVDKIWYKLRRARLSNYSTILEDLLSYKEKLAKLCLFSDREENLRNEINKWTTWKNKAGDMLNSKNYPADSVYEKVLSEGLKLKKRFPELQKIKDRLSRSRDWVNRVKSYGLVHGEAMIPVLKEFIREGLTLEVDVSKHLKLLETATRRYCICNQPLQPGGMIECSNCSELYHRGCVFEPDEPSFTCGYCDVDYESRVLRGLVKTVYARGYIALKSVDKHDSYDRNNTSDDYLFFKSYVSWCKQCLDLFTKIDDYDFHQPISQAMKDNPADFLKDEKNELKFLESKGHSFREFYEAKILVSSIREQIWYTHAKLYLAPKKENVKTTTDLKYLIKETRERAIKGEAVNLFKAIIQKVTKWKERARALLSSTDIPSSVVKTMAEGLLKESSNLVLVEEHKDLVKKLQYVVDDDAKRYCVCQGFNDDSIMVACEQCQKWYHSNCVGYKPDVGENEDKGWKCNKCNSKQGLPSTVAMKDDPGKTG
eukprot:augustus_masked-scaffold_27-processed-gene-2.10-mRNA-1 protein AED:1.00 eAED:1.00 QI:0/-1/0/0/-1/1/1/0/1987